MPTTQAHNSIQHKRSTAKKNVISTVNKQGRGQVPRLTAKQGEDF